MKWEALNIPDPETPVGARGIGEPPVAAGACAVLNALSDALGDDVYPPRAGWTRHDSDGARARGASPAWRRAVPELSALIISSRVDSGKSIADELATAAGGEGEHA